MWGDGDGQPGKGCVAIAELKAQTRPVAVGLELGKDRMATEEMGPGRGEFESWTLGQQPVITNGLPTGQSLSCLLTESQFYSNIWWPSI